MIYNDCEIQKALKDDLPEILELQRLAFRPEAVSLNDFSISPMTQTLEELQREFDEWIILKMEQDGKIIGSVRTHAEGNTAYINRIVVHPEYWNQGFGKCLLKAAEDAFPGKRYELFTRLETNKNVALYEKCGYKAFRRDEIKTGFTFVYMEK